MSITRKCGMCGDPVLRSNSGAPNRRCASCQRRYMATARALAPASQRAKSRAIQWYLEHGKDRSAEIQAFLQPKPVVPETTAEIAAAIRATKIAEFLKANGGPMGYQPLTEVEKIIQEQVLLAERKARGQLLHEQHKEQLLELGRLLSA